MLRLGTWNLENLFRPDAGSGAPTTSTAYESKLTRLAATIDALGLDAVAVQEVGSPEALDDLRDRLSGRWRAETADPDARGIRCGVLSRLPVLGTAQVRDFPELLLPVQVDDDGTTLAELGRPALRVRVGVPDPVGAVTAVDLVSVHLKSKLLTFPGGRFSPRDEDERARYAVYALHRRAAESAGVRAAATALLAAPDAVPVVVAGDLNDEPTAATTQILLGPPGSEIGTGGFDQPDRGDPQRLWNLAALIPEEDRYSRVYRGRRELIDHLLVSHALVTRVVTATTGGPTPPSVVDNPNVRVDDPVSDHRPVLVTLDV
ncbi:endonuclease/exonuclease/phosphatase family protein [Nocardioides iriomotensis]|uniref:Endonuclease n=1 Tax=Nocardioides iriomotensis TaxID=715784 RepID=A0A4Q5IUD7_9ACTN|nr:endonuclease/exonuclease/phosphatase family protein [Nocardioides iriomotensis]RYU09517.1 endonuclease [Nocardioides iriomotensis]